MAEIDEQKAEEILEQLARRSAPEQLEKLDLQFEAKLRRLEQAQDAPGEMADQLRVLWRMLRAPDEVVAWKGKALIMAAVSYFVSPVDLIPDAVGRAGYLDDAMLVRIVYGRLRREIEAFRDSAQE